jgi:hypothetical protein
MSLYIKLKGLKTSGCINAVRFVLHLFPKDQVTLTNASNQQDGYGAQIQRVLSIKAFADHMYLNFYFSEIKYVERQVTQTMHDFEDAIEQLAEINGFLSQMINASEHNFTDTNQIHLTTTKVSDVVLALKLMVLVFFRHKRILIKLEDAYSLIGKNTDLYRSIRIDRGVLNQRREVGIKKIDVHLRYVNFAQGGERFLDPEYYIENLTRIITGLEKAQSEYVITIHSDFTSNMPEPSSLGIQTETQKYLEDIGVLNGNGEPNFEVFEKAKYLKRKIQKDFCNVVVSKEKNALDSLIQMANSDFLICSKSSFSFVAGILNNVGEVTSPRYWNHPLSDWKNSTNF